MVHVGWIVRDKNGKVVAIRYGGSRDSVSAVFEEFQPRTRRQEPPSLTSFDGAFPAGAPHTVKDLFEGP